MSTGGHNPFLPSGDGGFGGSGFGGLPQTYAPAPKPKHTLESDEESEDDNDVAAKPLLKGSDGQQTASASNPFIVGGATGLSSIGSMKQSSSTASLNRETQATGGSSHSLPSTTNGTQKKPKQKTGWIFSVAYYQQFFDVDTEDVLVRARHASCTPWNDTFNEEVINENPDLYGPFWVCATLVFLIATGGEFSEFLSSDENSRAEWNFDVHAIASSSVVMYGYVFLVPVLVCLGLRCIAGVPTPPSLVQIICAYGYSLVSFIPASILSVFPHEIFTWACFMLATASGCLFLLLNVARPLSKDAKGGVAFQTPFVGSIIGAHVLFGVIIKLWFFTHF